MNRASYLTRQLLRLCAALLVFATLASPALAQTTTARFQNDYAPGTASYRGLEDTWVFENYPNSKPNASTTRSQPPEH